MSTLEKLQRLETLCASGYTDAFFDKALDKLISHQITNQQSEIEVIRGDLRDFEEKYNLDSQTFFEKYQSGQMSDDADFVEWNALYKMYRRLRQRLEILQGKHHDPDS